MSMLFAGTVRREREIDDLKRQLQRERGRLDWWAKKSLDTCTMDRNGYVGTLTSDNIRASIDHHRRHELVMTARRARGEPFD